MTEKLYKFELESDEEFLKEFGNNEVTVPDTLTDKGYDIDGGLFDQLIFGPIQDWTCKCGTYSGILYEGDICEECGMKISSRKLRYENYGYSKLYIDLPNPLYHKVIVKHILHMTLSKAEEILFGNNKFYLQMNPEGSLRFKGLPNNPDEYVYGDLVWESSNDVMTNDYKIYLDTGILMVKKYGELVDLDYNRSQFFDDKPNLFNFLKHNLTTNILRIIPVGYRDFNFINDKVTINSINLFYKFIITQSQRLKFFMQSSDYKNNARFWITVEYLVRWLESLYKRTDAEFRGKPVNSYSTILGQKAGLVRSSLLGKRVCFSARTVNTSSDPGQFDLAEDEVIVPFKLAKNLLRIHLIKLLTTTYARSNSRAMMDIDKEVPEVIECLHKLDGKFYVYISRAPALYKYSFMAFKLRINFNNLNDKTLKVHSLLNGIFNLDYDGDTMSVFLPITVQAQDEARINSTPSVNSFYDKNGSPIYNFSLEFIYGLYYATNPKLGDLVKNSVDSFYWCDYTENSPDITIGSKRIKRIFDSYNLGDLYKLGTVLDSKKLKNIVRVILNTQSIKTALSLLNDLMVFSCEAFSESGLSIKFNDFINLDKTDLIKSTNSVIKFSIEENKLINQIAEVAPPTNSYLSMVKSGAKGNYTQIKQVMIAKGVLVNNEGKYLDPIVHSLKEGLTFDEFITTISASRRGLANKSLSTANTGDAYYKIAKAARDIILTKDDCQSTNGLTVPLKSAIGRYLNKPLGDYPRNTLITYELYDKLLLEYGESYEVNIRSPLTCKCKDGICTKCYGINISKDKPSKVRDRVGVIAGSTISEIMSQAMLKTFHTAGATSANRITIKNTTSDIINSIEVKHIGDWVQVNILDKAYVFAKSNVEIHKDKDIKPTESILSYNTGNDDIGLQFKKLKSIIWFSEPSYEDSAIISPLDGKLELQEVVDKIEYEHDDVWNIDVPKHYKYIYATVTSEDSSADLYIPYTRTLLVPFNSEVKAGQLITNGFNNYKVLVHFYSKSELQLILLDDLKILYKTLGVDLRPIHLEVLVSCLIQGTEDDYQIVSSINSAKDRSLVQWASVGWLGQAYEHVADKLSVLGYTNADMIALGNYH